MSLSSDRLIVVIVDDFILLPPLLALREHLIGTESVDPGKIIMALAHPLLAGGVPWSSPPAIESMVMTFGISPRPLEAVLLDPATMNTPLEIIWSDTCIAHESFQELRNLIGRTSQLRGQITLSLAPDGSANRPSALSEANLMGLLQAEGGQINKGSFYSYGFIPSDTADRRPSFHHKLVGWFLVGCWFLGSELWAKPPYPDVACQIDAFVGDAKKAIWAPLRAICNDADYHEGNYHFGESDPATTTFRIYRRLVDLLIGARPELAGAPVILIGDMRTEKILRGRGPEAARSLIGENSFYFLQPSEVRFDFLIADFARRHPEAHNHVICGDSTTAIPLCGCPYRASFLMGYPMKAYIEAGASEEQCLYVRNRIDNWIRDAMTVLFATDKVKSASIRFEKLEEAAFLLDVQGQA